MEKDEMVEKLNSLIQLDVDAVHAYEQALGQIDDSVVHGQMSKYRDDHQRHIAELSHEVRSLGGKPPEYSPDFKGFLITGFTYLRSVTGTEGAMKAMHANEKLANRNYSDAVNWVLTKSAQTLIRKNFSDEKVHLEYIEGFLETGTANR